MPTGVHLRDARRQLFDAAERVLLRDGPNGLTSRAVTDEAGCAKGVLHRHFADFDAFLVALVLDRAAQLDAQALTLREAVGSGTVADNLTGALTALFGPVPVAIIPLITFRDELRARLRQTVPGGGIAILAQVAAAVSAYLSEERARAASRPTPTSTRSRSPSSAGVISCSRTATRATRRPRRPSASWSTRCSPGSCGDTRADAAPPSAHIVLDEVSD